MGIDASALALWGTSSSDMYFVGLNGSIVHYDGKDFEKQESGTDIDLRGIWGLDRDHIWVVGTSKDWSRSIVLEKEGDGWRTIYYVGAGESKPIGGFYSVWTDSYTLLYFNGLAGTCTLNLITGEDRKIDDKGLWMGEDIMGTGMNDIFSPTGGGEILHYNGRSWHVYREIKEIFGDYGVFTCVYVTRSVVIIGGYYPALRWYPIVLRGYR